jgi:hypothetical protein
MDNKGKIVSTLMRSLTRDLKGSHKFLGKLEKEDDWSFIIKSHAYMEAIISNLLLAKLGEPRLQKIIRRIELSNDNTGKLAFAKDLELLSKGQRRFIRSLSTLRNRLVHNIEMVNFSLSTYVKEMDSNAKKTWQDDLIWFDTSDHNSKVWRDLAINGPKTMLWFSLVQFVLTIMPEIKQAQLLHDIYKISNGKGQVVLKELLKITSKSISGGLTRRSS